MKQDHKQAMSRRITKESLSEFARALREAERSGHTIEKYLRDVRRLQYWAGDRTLTKERMIAYKESLLSASRYVNSINSYLVSANVYLEYMGWSDLKVRTYPVQQETAQPAEKQLTKTEYERLLQAAKKRGNVVLYLLLEVFASTGMRVFEIRYITAETVRTGVVRVYNKGKIREILLTTALRTHLLRYAKEEGITEGILFRSKKGTPLSRTTIWRWMKEAGEAARVGGKKVFPHNLRKLFARELYQANHKDIAHVADVLGHSNVNTTRRYIRQSMAAHMRTMERLGFVREDLFREKGT